MVGSALARRHNSVRWLSQNADRQTRQKCNVGLRAQLLCNQVRKFCPLSLPLQIKPTQVRSCLEVPCVKKYGWEKKCVAISRYAPDSDAHILYVRADGRDLAVHLAGPISSAAGRPLVAELAQLLYLHSGGLW